MARTAKTAALTPEQIDMLNELVNPKLEAVRTDTSLPLTEFRKWDALAISLANLKTKASEPAKTRAPRTPAGGNDATAAAAKKDKK